MEFTNDVDWTKVPSSFHTNNTDKLYIKKPTISSGLNSFPFFFSFFFRKAISEQHYAIWIM